MFTEYFLNKVKDLMENHFLIRRFFDDLNIIENDLFLKGKNAVDELAKENGNFALDVITIEDFEDIEIDYYNRKLIIKNLSIVSNVMEQHFRDLVNRRNATYIPNALLHIEVEKLVKDFDFLEFEESEDFNFLMGRFQDFMYFDFVDKFIHNNYKRILSKLKPLPPQQPEKPKLEQHEVLSVQITHPKRTEIAKAIKDKYSSYKGKDFKILYEALLELCLFPKKGKRSVFFRCLQNEGYNINNFQMLEDKHFQRGQTLKTTGKYDFTEDEKRRDEIIEYLKTIIETK